MPLSDAWIAVMARRPCISPARQLVLVATSAIESAAAKPIPTIEPDRPRDTVYEQAAFDSFGHRVFYAVDEESRELAVGVAVSDERVADVKATLWDVVYRHRDNRLRLVEN